MQGAFIDEFAAAAILLDGISCAGEKLRVIQIPETRGLLGIGSTFQAKAVANSIREEISAMSADGALALAKSVNCCCTTAAGFP